MATARRGERDQDVVFGFRGRRLGAEWKGLDCELILKTWRAFLQNS